jgi:hypothetical protein
MTDWRTLDGRPTAWFTTTSHAQGAAFAREVGARLGDAAPLDVDVRLRGVRVTVDDPSAAELVSTLAAERRMGADPAALQRLSVVLDAADPEGVRAFWSTVTGYAGGADLADPLRRDPSLRLRRRDDERPLRTRLHLDVSRPHELGRAAARAVAPDRAPEGEEWPYFLNVADPEGNEADLVPVAADDRFPADAGADDWRVVFGAKVRYAGGRDAVVQLVARAAELADAAGIPLMIDVRDDAVVLDSYKDRWEAEGFVVLAARVQAAARDLGLSATPDDVRFLQVGIDAVDVPAVREFWRAVLGYEHDHRDFLTDLVDPDLLDVPVFFQPTEAEDTARLAQRGRVHLRLDLPRDQVDVRIATATTAGGALLSVDEAAGEWVLADPEGNELHLHADPA